MKFTEYTDQLDSQIGLCATCKKPPAEGTKLFVDHNHVTGERRGLLCNTCNIVLGKLYTEKTPPKHYLANRAGFDAYIKLHGITKASETSGAKRQNHYRKRKVCIDLSERTRTTLTNPEIWSLCAASGCDPRTLRKLWVGQLVQESSGIRLWAALKAAGLLRAEAKRPFVPAVPLSPKDSTPAPQKDLASPPGGA